MKKEDILKVIPDNLEHAHVLAIFYNKVCVGKYINHDFIFDCDVDYSMCTQMRIFNDEKEVRLLFKNGKILLKIIDDTYGIDSYDEAMFLRDNKQDRLLVRNYLTVDDNHQVVIEDNRLVNFIRKED